MSKDKQIEEMAKTVCHLDRTCDQCMTSFECKAMTYAKRFYNAGYRKASDTAKEIIKHLARLVEDKEMLMSFYGKSGWFIKVDDVTDFIADINRMYEEGEG